MRTCWDHVFTLSECVPQGIAIWGYVYNLELDKMLLASISMGVTHAMFV